MEAASRIELENNGFAGRCLTTWPSRLVFWSGKRELNPRLRPWQGRTLPLSYSRSANKRILYTGMPHLSIKKLKALPLLFIPVSEKRLNSLVRHVVGGQFL